MKNKPLVSHDAAQRALEDAMRIRVGFGKRFTFSQLEDATGIPERTLRSYCGEGATPGMNALLSLFAVLGPSFTNDILALTGQTAQPSSAADPEHMRIIGMMGTLTAMLSKSLEDGHVDHREEAQMRPFAQELMEILDPMSRPDCENVIPHKGSIGE
jgi:hypothetical protein